MYVEGIWGKKDAEGRPTYPLHRFQSLAFSSKSRFTACISGTGGGKTALGALWSITKTEEVLSIREKCLGMVLAPTYKVLERATVPALIETFKGTHLEGEFKQHKSVYELPDGKGLIWCQGVDNPGGIEGGQFDWIWCDEGGQYSKTAWNAIQGRTGFKRAPVFITSTPYGFNWLYTDFYARYLKNDPDYTVVQWASIDNPAYPQEEFERAARTLNPDTFAMRYRGQFTRMEGMVYPNLIKCLTDQVTVDEVLSWEGKLGGGIDFGWNDPFAGVCFLLDKEDVLWMWYERYLPFTTIEDHAAALPKFLDRKPMWWCEHNPEFIMKLIKGGHKCKRAFKNIVPGIEAVNARINTQRLWILQSITNKAMPATIAEGGTYMYVNKDETFTGDKPDVNCEDHAMDAVRYGVCGFDIRKAA